MSISISHIPSWFPSTSSHTSIAQLIPQQQCSFVSYRWSPDRHSEGHITLSNLTLKSTNDWSLKHHAIYSFMHTKLSEMPSTPCTSTCKWTPGPHDLGCIIIPSLLPNYNWSHIKRQMYLHHYHRCSHILWLVLWPGQPLSLSFVLSSHASSSHQVPSGIGLRPFPHELHVLF